MKHSRISLIERAAEVYDFGAALRGRPAQPEPVSSPEAAPPPPRTRPGAGPQPVAAAAVQPSPTLRRPAGRTATIDRRALAAAGYLVPKLRRTDSPRTSGWRSRNCSPRSSGACPSPRKTALYLVRWARPRTQDLLSPKRPCNLPETLLEVLFLYANSPSPKGPHPRHQEGAGS